MSAIQIKKGLKEGAFKSLRYFNSASAKNEGIKRKNILFTHTLTHTHTNEHLICCSMGALGIKHLVGNLYSILLNNHD